MAQNHDYEEVSNRTQNITNTLFVSGNRVAVGTPSPATTLHVLGTDSLVVPVGTTAQRGTEVQGGIRYSTSLLTYEGYDGSQWRPLGGVIDVDRDTYIIAEDIPMADNDELDFFTRGSARMTITSAGNIGIGGVLSGADVTSRLHIYQDTGDTTIPLEIEASDCQINLRDTGGTVAQLGYIHYYVDMFGENMRLAAGSGGWIRLGADSANPKTVFGNYGLFNSVGLAIGHTDPGASLHIRGDGSTLGTAHDDTTSSPAVRFVTATGNNFGEITHYNNTLYLDSFADSNYGHIALRGRNNSGSTPIRLYVRYDGNVGIGPTTSPGAKLHVQGTFKADGNGTFEQDLTVDQNLTVMGSLSVRGDLTYLDTEVSVTSAMEITNSGTGPALKVQQTGTQPIAHFIDTNGDDVIIADDGKLGLGTFTPTAPLHISSQTNKTPTAAWDGHLKISGNSYSGGIALDQDAMWVGHNADNRSIYLATNETARMTVYEDGNVGIGTTTPNEKLTVAGNISASGELMLTNGSGFLSTNLDHTSGPEMKIYGEVGKTASLYFGDIGDVVEGGITYDTSTSKLFLKSHNNQIAVTIDSDENVGIGTTTPNERLTVVGDVSATGMIHGDGINMPNSTREWGYRMRPNQSSVDEYGLLFETINLADTSSDIHGENMMSITSPLSTNGSGDAEYLKGIGPRVVIGPGAGNNTGAQDGTITDYGTTLTITHSAGNGTGDGTGWGAIQLMSYDGAEGGSSGTAGTYSANEADKFRLQHHGLPGSGTVLAQSGDLPLRFSTNGSERMRIAGNGYVGIGTTTPSNALHIGNGGLNISGTSAFSNDARININAGGSTDHDFIECVNNKGDRFIVSDDTTNGVRVGIGTGSPEAQLHIINNENGHTGEILFDCIVTSGYDSSIMLTDTGLEFTAKSNANRGFEFKTGLTPTSKMSIKNNGQIDIGSTGHMTFNESGSNGNTSSGADIRFDHSGLIGAEDHMLFIAGGGGSANSGDIAFRTGSGYGNTGVIDNAVGEEVLRIEPDATNREDSKITINYPLELYGLHSGVGTDNYATAWGTEGHDLTVPADAALIKFKSNYYNDPNTVDGGGISTGVPRRILPTDRTVPTGWGVPTHIALYGEVYGFGIEGGTLGVCTDRWTRFYGRQTNTEGSEKVEGMMIDHRGGMTYTAALHLSGTRIPTNTEDNNFRYAYTNGCPEPFRTHTYMMLDGGRATTDWAAIRQIGTADNYHLSIDIHDNSASANDGTSTSGFSVRAVNSSAGATAAARAIFHTRPGFLAVGHAGTDTTANQTEGGELYLQDGSAPTEGDGWHIDNICSDLWGSTQNDKLRFRHEGSGAGDLGSRGIASTADSNSNGAMCLDFAGNLRLDGAIDDNSTSDINLKDDITPIESAIDKVKGINGVEFRWKEDAELALLKPGERSVGVIAQDVEKVLPTAVKSNSRDQLCVEYNQLIPLLVEAVKDQQTQIEDLKQQIADLQSSSDT